MERAAYDEMRALEDHHWWFRGKRRMLAPLIRRATARGGRLVDVGCGTGGNLAFVERRFPAVARLGLDFDAGALAYTRGRGAARGLVGLIRGDGTRLPFRDGSVDCVLALDIIEHFDDDAALIAEFRRVLAPGGELVASVPAYPWLWSPHDEFLHHRRRYRTGELQARLRAAGLEIREAHGFNFLLLPAVALVRLVKGRRAAAGSGKAGPKGTDFFELPGPLNATLAGLFAVEDALTRLVPVPFGVSLLVRARRPA
jgi:SAM-dependent methyltransferase